MSRHGGASRSSVPAREAVSAVSCRTKQVVHIADLRTIEPYLEGDPPVRAVADLGGCAHARRRPDAQGRRTDRRHRHLPPGGPAIHRQADRAGQEFRRPGRHRHREHPPAQRAARIAAAADRHRRRAQGHQPLDLRSADRARHAGRVGGAAVRGGHGVIVTPKGDALSGVACYGYRPTIEDVHATHASSRSIRPGSLVGRRHARRPDRSYPRRAGRSGIHLWRAAEDSAAIGPCSAFRCCAKESDRRHRPAAQRRCGRSPTSRSSWSPPSPTRR